MTVKDAKAQIVELLQALREDGIIVMEIRISWTAEVPANVAKPVATFKPTVTFVADL